MLSQLPPSSFIKIEPLFAPISYNLAIQSVLDSLTPAEVWVDDPSSPGAALIWWHTRVYLAGDLDNSVIREKLQLFLTDYFYPRARDKRLYGYTLFFVPGLEQAALDILRDKNPIAEDRHYYALQTENFTQESTISEPISLLPVNQMLLSRDDLQNPEFLIEEMLSERPSVEDFLAKSFGCCAIQSGKIIGWCLSEYNAGPRCELGIMTAEGFRRQGVAKAMAAAVIQQARLEGIAKIGWHCWAHNRPSIATALALGFELHAVYPVVHAYFDEQVNLIVNGIVALNGGRAHVALDWFDRARLLGPLPSWAEDHAARAKRQAA